MYQQVKCPTCGTNLQVTTIPEYCPVQGCGAYIKDKLHINYTGSGLNDDIRTTR